MSEMLKYLKIKKLIKVINQNQSQNLKVKN